MITVSSIVCGTGCPSNRSGWRRTVFQLNTLNVGGSGWVVLESSSDLVN